MALARIIHPTVHPAARIPRKAGARSIRSFGSLGRGGEGRGRGDGVGPGGRRGRIAMAESWHSYGIAIAQLWHGYDRAMA